MAVRGRRPDARREIRYSGSQLAPAASAAVRTVVQDDYCGLAFPCPGAEFEASLAVVGGADRRHRDAVECRKALKAMFDYLAGTLAGAAYAGGVTVLIPHSNEIALLAVLAFCVAPLALVAAINPSLNVAPITAIIVILVPTITHASPIASAFDRVLEVALGGITGFAVTLLLLPGPWRGRASRYPRRHR
jgi:Fusaric acid resistance protein-like